MTKAGKTKKATVQVVKYLVIALLVCILLFPIWWMLVGSLRPYYTLISLDDVAFWPKDFTVENYVKIFSQAKYLRYFANSFIVSGGTVLVRRIFFLALQVRRQECGAQRRAVGADVPDRGHLDLTVYFL